MKIKSVKVDEHAAVQAVKVVIGKRDLIKIFVAVAAAEMLVHWPVGKVKADKIREAVGAVGDQIEDEINRRAAKFAGGNDE